MSLPITVLQSLLSRNRDVIASLHIVVGVNKGHRDFHSQFGLQSSAECFHKKAVKCSKDIEKLVILQKALKKEMVRAMFHAKVARIIQGGKNKELCVAQAGEVF